MKQGTAFSKEIAELAKTNIPMYKRATAKYTESHFIESRSLVTCVHNVLNGTRKKKFRSTNIQDSCRRVCFDKKC